MSFIYKVLVSDMELLAAALSEVNVTVAVKSGAGIVEPGGPIRAYTPNSVRIRGLPYNRELHEFRVTLEWKERN
ncbi:hypothetical protein [Paenibacillus riograndensis]|uniref:Uncharacterized protein n=1 Tax=Paenibacillus riograndensis SBR5 TaxID=1073571 RepID=A0A0E4CWF2_9BACL|nr:hypothetical protein [Paenibacillus riograndensis]CQR55214.1 hypothetical protein PRIO_2810 [Paenibacillus riograndensis SBR5]